LMYDRAPQEYAKQDRHLWEPFLHKSQLVYCVLRHTNGLKFTSLP